MNIFVQSLAKPLNSNIPLRGRHSGSQCPRKRKTQPSTSSENMKRTKAGDFTSVKNLVLSRDLSGNFLSTVFMVTPLGCSLSDARFRKLLALSLSTRGTAVSLLLECGPRHSLDLAGFGQLLRLRVTSGDLRRRGEKSRSEVKFGRNRTY